MTKRQKDKKAKRQKDKKTKDKDLKREFNIVGSFALLRCFPYQLPLSASGKGWRLENTTEEESTMQCVNILVLNAFGHTSETSIYTYILKSLFVGAALILFSCPRLCAYNLKERVYKLKKPMTDPYEVEDRE